MLTFFSSTINKNIFFALLFENIHILLKLWLKLCMVLIPKVFSFLKRKLILLIQTNNTLMEIYN